MYGLDLSAVEAMADVIFGVADEGRPVGGILELDLLLGARFILYRKAIDRLIIRPSTACDRCLDVIRLKRTNILKLQADILSAGHESHRRLRSY